MGAYLRLGLTAALLGVVGFVGSPAATAGPLLHCAGASVRVPGGWYGRVSPGGGGGFLILVSTVPFAAAKGDVLGGTLEHLDRGGVLVALLGYGAVDPADKTFPPLRSALAARGMPVHSMFEGMPRGDSVARRSFRARGAGYDVQIYFGTEDVTPHLRVRADAVLAALRFAPTPPQPAASGARTRC